MHTSVGEQRCVTCGSKKNWRGRRSQLWYRLPTVSSSFTKSFKSYSYLLAGPPTFLWGFVGVTRTRFHPAAVQVHLAGFLGGDPRGFSPSQFLPCLDPFFAVLYVSNFSAASLVLFFVKYSIQSSYSSSWLDVLSVSFSNAILLAWSHSSFVLSSFLDSLVASLISSSHVIPSKAFCCCFLSFLFCLNDETKQCALGSTKHFVVFLCCSSCSCTIRYCR